MSDENNQLVKAQFLAMVPAGSVLSKVLAELPAEEIARLKSQAADGMLAIEITRIVTQHKLQVTATEIDIILQSIRGLQREHQGPTSSYKQESRIQTASGETTITSKKGCFIATAVYGDFEHPNVLILRRFRDERLERNHIGRLLCAFYYWTSPRLARSVFSKGQGRILMKTILDRICRNLIRLFQ